MVSEHGETTLYIAATVPLNILTKPKGMAKPEWVEALEHKLEELEGVSNALWESLDHRVGTLEKRMNAHDSGSSKAP